jgi:glycosyltransferase involved in cell wall biosynthesis
MLLNSGGKVNILFLSELFYPHGSGAEFATYLYAKLLSEMKFDISVVTNGYNESNVLKKDNLIIYRLPLFKKDEGIKYSVLARVDVLFSSFMRKMLKWADIVYIPRFWYSAIPLAKAYRKPVITHLHDYISLCPLASIYNVSKDKICDHNHLFCQLRCIYTNEKLQGSDFIKNLMSSILNSTIGPHFGKIVNFSDAVICVSEAQKDIITKRRQSLRDKTYVVHNPIPPLSYIKIEGDDLGYFSGPSYLKGFHILCHAIMRINKDNQRMIKVHATKFLNLPKQFAKLLSRIGIFPYGKLDKDEYERLYKQIRAVIFPSIWPEPWPYVMVEAILRGRFVIASGIGGILEQVKGCKGTLLLEAGNYEQLAEAIEFMKTLSRETITDLGFQNREIFLKKFNNEIIIKKLISIFESLT